jgi:hypothetical protein
MSKLGIGITQPTDLLEARCHVKMFLPAMLKQFDHRCHLFLAESAQISSILRTDHVPRPQDCVESIQAHPETLVNPLPCLNSRWFNRRDGPNVNLLVRKGDSVRPDRRREKAKIIIISTLFFLFDWGLRN